MESAMTASGDQAAATGAAVAKPVVAATTHAGAHLPEHVGRGEVAGISDGGTLYGRPIAEMFVDQFDINAEHVRRGMAWARNGTPRIRGPHAAGLARLTAGVAR
jgi:hypothetical protein